MSDDHQQSSGGAGGGSSSSSSSSEKNMFYDDFAFELFAVVLLSMIAIPCSLVKIYKAIRGESLEQKKESRKMAEFCDCVYCHEKKQRIQKQHIRNDWSWAYNAGLVIVWILVLWLAYRVYNQKHEMEAPFDPFELLGVTAYASDKEIKAAYRRLSRIYHPDKNPGDLEAEKRFVKLAKAYEALTDDVAKENYRKYGNPDGYRGTSYGIALPAFMVNHGKYLLLAYFIVIVCLFPLVVGLWWRSSSKKMSNSVLTSTYRMYIFFLARTNLIRNLLVAYTASFEFQGTFRKENLPALVEVSQAMKKADKFDLKKAKYPFPSEDWMSQGLIVINAYINRVPMPEILQPILHMLLERLDVLGSALADSVAAVPRQDAAYMTYMMSAKGILSSLLNSLRVTQMLCQAVNEKDSPLLQIPYFTETEIKYCSSRKNKISTVLEFAALDLDARKQILRGFTPEQWKDLEEFLARYPDPLIEPGEPYVEEENDQEVHEGDAASIDIKLAIRRKKGSVLSPCTWRLPHQKEEVWWIIFGDQQRDVILGAKRLTYQELEGINNSKKKKDKIKVKSQPLENGPLDADIISEQSSETKGLLNSNDSLQERFEVKFNFVAPPEGKYDLVVYAVCDTYFGSVRYVPVKLNVLPRAQTVNTTKYFDTDDESEEDAGDDASDHSDHEEKEEEDDSDVAPKLVPTDATVPPNAAVAANQGSEPESDGELAEEEKDAEEDGDSEYE
mmetsp:Transcript_10625/g.18232  ORF Transcript_10625/g.18232 Transcript_10625/m.18232 type:complete len:728 (-) Transcript_10625:72-2255(-)|eukprot:CAMPEP_0184706046 /NCGR_PEP_ID=MMETSP0313-20130426/36399_1 /TAXON_ID=2792 /ORGANISM="Porphyridium aerugineum, Strain SAG 1380-2" /LENGTH=727 /DNA_ID=CAMNT_0027167571 /DNA_START=205 /DNA_END=2388 /DNA_ORIENTATION=-